MKITVLDGYSVNPGDMSWDKIAQLGELTVYDRTLPSEIVERAKDSEIVLTNKVILDRKTVEQLPKMKYIGILATGTNVVDIEAARERGVVVSNIPAYSTESVAQMVFALLLAVTNRVEFFTEQNRKGRWSACADFCYWESPLTELAGKCFGIIGFGNIGKSVARIARAFEMKVIAFTSKEQSQLPEGVEKATSLDDLLRRSDVVSLHCPLTEDTREMINAETLKLMKPSAILINTGRGPLVNEADLAQALHDGKLRAAAVDVLSKEPPTPDNPLLAAPNCYITPHVAWASTEARRRLMDIEADNIKSYLAGKPINVVD